MLETLIAKAAPILIMHADPIPVAGPTATGRTDAYCKVVAQLARKRDIKVASTEHCIMVIAPETLCLCPGQAGKVRFRADGALASGGRTVWARAAGRRATPGVPWQLNSPEKTGQSI